MSPTWSLALSSLLVASSLNELDEPKSIGILTARAGSPTVAHQYGARMILINNSRQISDGRSRLQVMLHAYLI